MKKLVIFAGPNGSGKTTITKEELQPSSYYVNADKIQKELGLSEKEAAQKAEETREKLLAEGLSFSFESVLSTMVNIDLLFRAKMLGYYIVCYFVLTCDPNINIRRVAERAERGGHAVPPDTVYYRYLRSLTLMPILFSVCNQVYVYDNSCDKRENASSVIISCVEHNIVKKPSNVWSVDMLNSLVLGKYPTDFILRTDCKK